MVGDSRISIGRIGGVGARQGVVAADTLEYKDGKPGGFDPHARIPDMDADGMHRRQWAAPFRSSGRGAQRAR